MEKQNLVTQKDSHGLYDLLKCPKCGFKQKYYGLQRPDYCPKCKDGKPPKPIWGGWTLKDPISSICTYCKTVAIAVPKEGHPNSRYWRMQREEKEVLFCCPNGCLEDGSYIYKKTFVRFNRRKGE